MSPSAQEDLSLVAVPRLARHAEPERPPHRGPGWFDSSFDLRRGCEVREGWPGDAGLRDWIEGWLYGAAERAFCTATPRSTTAIA